MRKHRSSFAAAPRGPAPISELNTTPLIDVMLVLLIMFIITIPISTHKVPLDLPQGDARQQDPVVHRLDLDAAGRLTWDGRSISRSQLPASLAAMRAEPDSVLHLSTAAETRYEDFDRVLATVKQAGINRMGMVGNERYAPALD